MEIGYVPKCLAGNVGICVCRLHHPNNRHFCLSPTCHECQPNTSATFCYVGQYFGCQCRVGEFLLRTHFPICKQESVLVRYVLLHPEI
jgi:hypothetical protein